MTEFEIQIKKLIEEGIALIPDFPDGHERQRTPCVKWKSIQRPFEFLDFIDKCKNVNTDLVEAICGLPSGGGVAGVGLICIDVDSKHKQGFSATILNDFRELYPDLYAKFRIDKTPSGGLHIYYRLNVGDKEFPRGGNIASRYTTDEEKIYRQEKSVCFLELKASELLSRCYPSKGYVRIKGEKLETLSWEDHSIIMTQLRFYNELIRDEYIKPPSSYESRYVDGENPFQKFDKSEEASRVLLDDGWDFYKRSGSFDWYNKKWKKGSREVGATFNNETRLYKIYTTNAELDAKSYSPSNLLCQLRYGNNKKELYEVLVAKGFGRLKPNIERNIVKARVLDGKELPKNFSEEGCALFQKETEKLREKYPFGTFWKEAYKEGGGVDYKISREDLYRISRELGFRKFKEKICWISGYKIEYVQKEFYYNTLKEYIIKGLNEEDVLGLREEESPSLDLINTYEAFLQASGDFTVSRLDNLDLSLVLRSSKKESLKFYKNCYLKIRSDDVEICSYDDMLGIIWNTDIKQRDFHHITDDKILFNSTYYTFLKNAIGLVDDYVLKCMGFYAHDHRDEDGYMIIATEKCESPEDGGGSGKNIFWSLFNLITTFKSTPAVLVNLNTNLLQSWDGQRIFVVSDMPKNFEITFFKDIVTGNATVNKKYINEFEIEIEDMCKIGGSSNFSFDNSDPGIRRRVRPIEFTDYYTLRGGVNKVHGGRMFPKDWDSVELLHFDNIMVIAIQEYLNADSKIEKKDLSDGGWNKQFTQKYNHLHDFIKLNIEEFCALGKVKNEFIKKLYEDYCNESNIFGKWRYSMTIVNKAMIEYCRHRNIGFDSEYTFKENNVQYRGKRFFNSDEEETGLVIELEKKEEKFELF